MRFIRLGNHQLSSSQSTELRNKIEVLNHQVKTVFYRCYGTVRATGNMGYVSGVIVPATCNSTDANNTEFMKNVHENISCLE